MKSVASPIVVESKLGGKLECRRLRKSVALKLPEAAPRGLSEEHYNQAAAMLAFRWCVVGASGFDDPDGGSYHFKRVKDPVLGMIASESIFDVIDLEHDLETVLGACEPAGLSEDDEGK